MKGGWIAWMAGNPVAANLAMLVLIIGGIVMALRIKQEVFPFFQLDMVTVSVAYPGASPEEVERGIVLAVEEAIQSVDGVDEIRSSAREGFATITAELVEGSDLQKLATDIKTEVDRITSLPEDAEEPKVTVRSMRREVINFVIYGDQSEAVLRELGEQVRDDLLQYEPPPPKNPVEKIRRLISGSPSEITQVDLSGVRPYEISIEISQQDLRRYGLTLGQVTQRLRNASVELPGGSIKEKGGEILVRVRDRRDFGRDFARIPIITRTDGTPVYLEDIATVIDGFEDIDRYARYNGKPAVMVNVYRVGEQTPLEISDAVIEYVEKLKSTLPEGINVNVVRDRSYIYRQRLELLLRNGAIGLGLVLILLSVFLELRLAFWVAMGIPISFFGAFLILPMHDLSINMVSLFAFIISLGIVVDDAIVVGENIYTHHQNGRPFGEAASLGAKEVAVPVTYSVLTNIVAFMPMLFVPGVMGKIFKNIPLVVIWVFAISLIECLFILPAHLGHQRENGFRLFGLAHKWQQKFSHGFIRLVRAMYGPTVTKALRFRYVTVAIALAILFLVGGYAKSGRLGFTLFPKVESDYSIVTVVLPYGTPVERTEELHQRIVDAAQQIIAETEEASGKPLSEGIEAEIGGSDGNTSGPHVLQVRVYLTDPETRPMQTAEFTNLWRKRVGPIAGVERIRYESDAGGPGSGAALTVEIGHRNLEVLKKASAELADIIESFPKAKDVDDGFAPGKKQYNFHIKPEGEVLGLTSRDVARQVRNAYYGAEVVRQQRNRNEMKIMVRFPEQERSTAYSLEQFLLKTPAGTDVPLGEVVRINTGRAYTSIDRRAGRRVITVTADVTPRPAAGAIVSELVQDSLPSLQRKYPGLSYGFEGRQAQQRESIGSLRIGLLLAVGVIYILLAIPFRSYTQPAIIMISIPFGIVGAVLGHILMGYSLSILSMFGVVALSGVVVNDALVLIDFANRKSRDGMSHFDAIREAGIARFRAIFLTTMTTFGGLTPMIFETSRQARFLIPMAISLGFGIVFATLITLILVPCLYLILDDVGYALGFRRRDS